MKQETSARLEAIEKELEHLVELVREQTTDEPNNLTYNEYSEMFQKLLLLLPQFKLVIDLLRDTRLNWD